MGKICFKEQADDSTVHVAEGFYENLQNFDFMQNEKLLFNRPYLWDHFSGGGWYASGHTHL